MLGCCLQAGTQSNCDQAHSTGLHVSACLFWCWAGMLRSGISEAEEGIMVDVFLT